MPQADLTVWDVLSISGLKNPRSIYNHRRKGNITGRKRIRLKDGLEEWVFTQAEAERFAHWLKVTPRLQR